MKKLISVYLNWRIYVLSVLGMFALLLIASDNDNMTSFLLSKALGFALAYGCYRLGKYWDGKGQINELMVLAEEE